MIFWELSFTTLQSGIFASPRPRCCCFRCFTLLRLKSVLVLIQAARAESIVLAYLSLLSDSGLSLWRLPGMIWFKLLGASRVIIFSLAGVPIDCLLFCSFLTVCTSYYCSWSYWSAEKKSSLPSLRCTLFFCVSILSCFWVLTRFWSRIRAFVLEMSSDSMID